MLSLEPFTEEDIPRLLLWIDTPQQLLHWAGTAFTFPLDQSQMMTHLYQANQTQPPTTLIYKATTVIIFVRESVRVGPSGWSQK